MLTAGTFHPSRPSIEDNIVIERPVADVFAFYSDFRNLPKFLGDVVRVEPADSNVWRWTVQGPFGAKIHWTSVITEREQGRRIFYETSSAMFKTRWEVTFAEGQTRNETVVYERLFEPGGRLGSFVLAMLGKHPAAEVHSNLHRLKQLIENGRVTDLSNAVPGKFHNRR
ncbi:hypothetical protein MA20_06900 [Bradyrhizobium japonicum]|uniref:Ribosome association toxin RatA n=1 Tax=Bradyrhizobium japonicum TaxID=375 RepID=A0A0A3Y447_BRAJP|nr:SRPBCC family protein [Bradyrhizobium japonicum]KGT80344.1 hypothetical protein MA20_06900 [Bradyrhizobium japonicum]